MQRSAERVSLLVARFGINDYLRPNWWRHPGQHGNRDRRRAWGHASVDHRPLEEARSDPQDADLWFH